jgi:putative DNA primase/helicase
MTLEEFVGRLSGVQRNGDGYRALCPSHPDRKPSLSVSAGDDERILVKCWTGCTSRAIVVALGLELRDLFADRRRRGR